MTYFKASHALPNQDLLQQVLVGYYQNESSHADQLYDVLRTTFSSYGEQQLSVERALATVMTAVDRAAGPLGGTPDPSTMALKRTVMKCCLEYYYPDLGPVGR